MPARVLFGPEFFRFLRELRTHNRREWFNANKERYEEHVKRPMLELISEVGGAFAKFAPRISADPRPVGGSMMRIYRDTRFSKDKTPYKTNAGAHFTHRAAGKDIHAPGYYLHLEPRASFIGAGLWRPEPPVAQKIREAIVARPKPWRAATRAVRLEGDSLARPPRGFDPDSPLIVDLKRKDFITSFAIPDRTVASPRFVQAFAAGCKKAAPLMQFLTEAMGLDW